MIILSSKQLRIVDDLITKSVLEYPTKTEEEVQKNWDAAIAGNKIGIVPEESRLQPSPFFSSDRSLSLSVIDKLRDNKWFAALEQNPTGSWHVTFTYFDKDGTTRIAAYSEDASSMQLAICLAALKTVGIFLDLVNGSLILNTAGSYG